MAQGELRSGHANTLTIQGKSGGAAGSCNICTVKML